MLHISPCCYLNNLNISNIRIVYIYSTDGSNVVFFVIYQKAKKLNVFKNDEETWDYTGALNGTTGKIFIIV